MSKLRKALRWFWHYQVAIVTTKGVATFEHRLFRQPLMRWDAEPVRVRGKEYTAVLFDEMVPFTPELQAELEAREALLNNNGSGNTTASMPTDEGKEK